jgi:hypothetical protein
MKMYRGVVVKLHAFYNRSRLKMSNQIHASTGLSLTNSTLNKFEMVKREPLLVIGAARTILQGTRKFVFRLTFKFFTIILLSFSVHIVLERRDIERGLVHRLGQ